MPIVRVSECTPKRQSQLRRRLDAKVELDRLACACVCNSTPQRLAQLERGDAERRLISGSGRVAVEDDLEALLLRVIRRLDVLELQSPP